MIFAVALGIPELRDLIKTDSDPLYIGAKKKKKVCNELMLYVIVLFPMFHVGLLYMFAAIAAAVLDRVLPVPLVPT